ncbi:hypothetical protein GCM10018980_40050 [Streptomyces capoamus]|uniref:Uncharacterized protein n=1 Tax=Streptomyces capoamus TaxID=68183 RepID=A0A919C875_9ACTN|nr:hypothetical protein [Streptomyces capoamus]GGW15173.1 hypothetical protein GCM10010501_26130 [Streptomyces libani subsp. rufus]GHG54970.1 hypothetical protein GCM10018980_40050 [Streptomyces capoamus]
MSKAPGTTPGLRVPLTPVDSGLYLLAFGPGGERHELITNAQLMTFVVEAAKELGLALSAPTRKL